jgi:hypothetical protein
MKLKQAIQKTSALLEKITVSDLMAYKRRNLGFRKTIVVDKEKNLTDLFDILKSNNLSAVCVVDQEPSKSKFVGMASILDILSWSIFQKVFEDSVKTDKDWLSEWIYGWQFDKSDYFRFTKVKDIMCMTKESSDARYIDSRESLLTLINLFTGSSQSHHILAVDETSEKNGPLEVTSTSMVITQTDLVHFMYDELKKNRSACLNEIFNLPISKASFLHFYVGSEIDPAQPILNKPLKPHVISCSLDTPSLAVFRYSDLI